MTVTTRNALRQSTATTKVAQKKSTWRKWRCAFLDLDGVVFRGDDILPGVEQLNDLAATHGISLMVVSNNSSHSPAAIARRLKMAGLSIEPRKIVTAADVTRIYLESTYKPGTRLMVVGTTSLKRALFENGHFVSVNERPRVVVVGRLYRWPWNLIVRAARAIREGADFIGTNPDTFIPGEDGVVPETGATLAYIAAVSGRQPKVLGKPDRAIFEIALERSGRRPHEVLMIGDRLEIDVVGACHLGIGTALISSDYDASPADIPAALKPDLTVGTLADLVEAWNIVLRDRSGGSD